MALTMRTTRLSRCTRTTWNRQRQRGAGCVIPSSSSYGSRIAITPSVGFLSPSTGHCICWYQSGKRTLWTNPPQDSTQTTSLSERAKADLEETLTQSISRKVKDPILKRDVVSLGWVGSQSIVISQDGTTVQILLRLPSLLHPELERLKQQVTDVATKSLMEWKNEKNDYSRASDSFLAHVNVEAIATSPAPFMSRLVDNPEELLKELGPGLEKVAHVLAVYSCKGGVGKSTIAVNLSYELARQGGRVGLLDLDLYGPSLPLLVQPNDKAIRKSAKKGSGMIYPIENSGVRLLSLGYVNTNSGVQGSGENNGAAIMRGPLVVKVVAQLLKGTDWGELDVLVLDLPPGTGDVQLAVCQELAMSGAVAVSTPSKLATEDTRKGIEMFQSLGVPTLAVVENMSYFMVSQSELSGCCVVVLLRVLILCASQLYAVRGRG